MHLKATTSRSKELGARSVCMRCKYKLKWYDNIPIVSWLCLGGKCRKCKCKIGVAEIVSELGMGCGFAMLGATVNIGTTSPIGWGIFGMTLALMIVFGGLAIYDGLYGELPVVYLIISIVCAVIILVLKECSWLSEAAFSINENILWPLGSVLIWGGLYLVLYLVSRGKWVGDGDWLLGTAIGLTLMSPWLALVSLCIANVLACIVMLPMLKKSQTRKIHFGPFMVVAWVITTALADVLMGIV